MSTESDASREAEALAAAERNRINNTQGEQVTSQAADEAAQREQEQFSANIQKEREAHQAADRKREQQSRQRKRQAARDGIRMAKDAEKMEEQAKQEQEQFYAQEAEKLAQWELDVMKEEAGVADRAQIELMELQPKLDKADKRLADHASKKPKEPKLFGKKKYQAELKQWEAQQKKLEKKKKELQREHFDLKRKANGHDCLQIATTNLTKKQPQRAAEVVKIKESQQQRREQQRLEKIEAQQERQAQNTKTNDRGR